MVKSSQTTPFFSFIKSLAPLTGKEITGVPHDIASSGVWLKVSSYQPHISSHISQNEVNHVWSGVEKVLFDGSKDIHFKKFEAKLL